VAQERSPLEDRGLERSDGGVATVARHDLDGAGVRRRDHLGDQAALLSIVKRVIHPHRREGVLHSIVVFGEDSRTIRD
jgi:hypothetical protein